MARVPASATSAEGAGQKTAITLVLADAQPIELRGLQHVFGAEPDLKIAASCTTAEETVAAVAEHKLAVLVLDSQFPPSGGLAVLRGLASRRLRPHVVLLAGRVSDDEMLEAVRLGVKGVVLKQMAPEFLVQCVRHVSRGQMWIENGSFAGVVDRMVQQDTRMRDLRQRLTPRELEVLELVGEGLRNRDIVARLAITEGTVKIHLHHIYRKLGSNDRLQLALRTRDERIA